MNHTRRKRSNHSSSSLSPIVTGEKSHDARGSELRFPVRMVRMAVAKVWTWI